LQADEGSGTLEERGKTQLRQGRLDAYVVVDADILEGPGKIRTYTYEPKPGNQDALGAVENTVRNAVRNRRYEKRDLDSDMLDKLRRVQTERIELGPADEERIETEGDRIVRMMAPFFFMYLLFLGIIGMGQQMLSSIIEEKNSRVIEVLLSALSPFELMAGKILGLVGVGLTVVSLWGFSTYFAARYQGLNVDIGAAMLSCFVLYYVLAFFLFTEPAQTRHNPLCGADHCLAKHYPGPERYTGQGVIVFPADHADGHDTAIVLRFRHLDSRDAWFDSLVSSGSVGQYMGRRQGL
ncbi:MAG: ABC transporter permease, partial [Planctomycetota bacterium]